MPIVSDLLPRYRRYALLERGLREATYRQTGRLVVALADFAKSENIHDFETSIIREFLHDGRENLLWSVKTFRLYRQYLKGFFEWCVQSGRLDENPVDPIGQPKLQKKLPNTLNKEQAIKLLAVVRWHPWRYELEGHRNEAIFAMFIYTGIRLGELLSLSADDVRLEVSEIIVRSGKGGKDRKLAVHPRLVSVLRSYERARKRHGASSRWYFPSVRSSSALTQKNVYRAFDKVSKRLGVKVRPHMLRHTFGRLCVEANVNMRIVKSMMGHASISTTEIYTQVSPEAMKRGMENAPLL